VNRCLRDWQRRGIVEIHDRWIVLAQEETLRELADHA